MVGASAGSIVYCGVWVVAYGPKLVSGSQVAPLSGVYSTASVVPEMTCVGAMPTTSKAL